MSHRYKSLLKIPTSDIDMDTINHVLVDMIEGKGKRYSDELIIHIIKALSLHFLNFYYDDYDVEIISQNELAKKTHIKDSVSLMGYKKIYLSREKVLELRFRDLSVLNDLLHECWHVRQEYLFDLDVINYETWLLAIEDLISSSKGHKYHKDNYWIMYDEVTARRGAAVAEYFYLKELYPRLAAEKLPEFLDIITACQRETKVSKRLLHHQFREREELADRLIRRRPYLLREYPLLNFYYFPDGTKIPIGTILIRKNDYQNIDDENAKLLRKVKKLDNQIIAKRSGTRANLQRDLESLYDEEVIRACQYDVSLMKQRQILINQLCRRLEETKNGDNIIDCYDNVQNSLAKVKYHFYLGARVLKGTYLIIRNFKQQAQKKFIKRKRIKKE